MLKPEISVIIVNWRVRRLVEQCLKSILAYSDGINIEIIVVDNDSRDNLAEMLMMDFPDVKFVGLDKNCGFAKATNLAIKQAAGEIICLLNPDTELMPNFFPGVLKYFQEHSEVSLLGPKLLNPDGSPQASIRRLPDLKSQILILFKLKNILPQHKYLANYLAADFDYSREQSVDQIMGAAMICRRDLFDKIGLFDEHFFVWFEEVDLCYRVKKAGLDIRYVPQLQIIHHGGASFKLANSLGKQWIFDRSLVYYFWKNRPWYQALVLTLLVPINLCLTIIYVLAFKNKPTAF
ncbi:MAG: glycosyltransferase family 2 protein [Patescibacteria group bacterium]